MISAAGMPPVVVVGSHPAHGYSMRRYTSLLREGYESLGHAVKVITPPTWLSNRTRSPKLSKMAAYVELLLLFPFRLAVRGRGSVWHFADHSDALLLLAFPRRQTIVTCHDLIAVRAARGELAEHRPRWSGRVYQHLVSMGLRRATLIEAVSGATQADVSRILPGSHVITVRNPLDPSFGLSPGVTLRGPFRADYVMIVSSVGWRKRRSHAILVWKRLSEAAPSVPLDLVLVGPGLTQDEGDLVAAAAGSHVEVFSGVSDARLAELYAGAQAVIQASLYEGFGWPILEANSMGTPAICSRLSIFDEVGGHAAIFIDDELEKNDWTAIRSRMSDPDLRSSALANAQRFTMESWIVQLKHGLAHTTL